MVTLAASSAIEFCRACCALCKFCCELWLIYYCCIMIWRRSSTNFWVDSLSCVTCSSRARYRVCIPSFVISQRKHQMMDKNDSSNKFWNLSFHFRGWSPPELERVKSRN